MVEDLEGASVPQALSRPTIQRPDIAAQLSSAEQGQIGAFGQILAQQADDEYLDAAFAISREHG